VFVRDRADRGTEPVDDEEGGPSGHHFSCDFLVDNTVASFRFTVRDTDYRFVLDRSFTKKPDGKFTVLDGRWTRYDPATPGFETMSELLLAVDEVQRAANIRTLASPYDAYMPRRR
jgi:hypothetical protein